MEWCIDCKGYKMSSLISLFSPFNGSTKFWIKLLGGANSDAGTDIAVDSSGNVYVTGHTGSQGAGGNDILITKYNTSGVIQWQRTFGGASSDVGTDIAVDSSGNVYVTGHTLSNGTYNVLIAKYNTSGVTQWLRTLGGTGDAAGYSIAVDSSGNVYVTGYTVSDGAYDILIAKYNTSGVIQWQRTLGGTSNDTGNSIAADSSGNVYVTGYTGSQGDGTYNVLIAKYNTSGVIQWQRTLSGAGTDTGAGIAVDSSGNVYVTGYTGSQGDGTYDILIAKYDTSGVIQWQRTLSGTSNDAGTDIAVDSSGNVYVTGYTGSRGAGGNDILITKYNTSGVIQWQRTFGGASGDVGTGIAVDSSGNVYVTGYTGSQGDGTYDILIAKLPSNGSLAGTYGNFIYQASTLTDTTSTLTTVPSALTDTTSALTTVPSALTTATSTLTETVIL